MLRIICFKKLSKYMASSNKWPPPLIRTMHHAKRCLRKGMVPTEGNRICFNQLPSESGVAVNFWMKPKYMLKKINFKELLKYFRFLIGGGLSLLIGLGITYSLTEFAGLWHMLSLAIATGLEVIFLFLYHSVITFKKKGKFWLFLFVVLFISDLNWILVYVASVIWKFNYLISIIAAAGMVSFINFGINRALVFKK